MGLFDDISKILGTDGGGGGILGIFSHLTQEVGHALAGVDKFVSHSIPGGWATVGAATLMAVGITNPTLLGLADSGELSADAIATLPEDQITALTQTIDTLQPMIDEGTITGSDIGTLLSSPTGFTPTDITSLVDSGWSGSDLTTIASHGFTPTDLTSLTDAGFSQGNLLDIAAANTDTPFQVSDLTNLIQNGATPDQVTELTTSGFNPTSLNDLVSQGYNPGDLADALANGASPNQIEYLNANGWTSDLNNYLSENGITPPEVNGEGAISQHLPGGINPTGPVEPTAPVTNPMGPPPQIESPFSQLTSNGISDMPEGTIVNNGQDVVMANGKTVPLDDYLSAIDSGKPISIDGALQTQSVSVELSNPEIPTEPVSPGGAGSSSSGVPTDPNYSIDSAGNVIKNATGENLGSAAENGFTQTANGTWTDGATELPGVEVTATKAGLTAGQIAALGGGAAAVAAIATLGSGGAASAANATIAKAGGAGATNTFGGTTPGGTTPGGTTPGGTTPGGTGPIDTTTGPINPTNPPVTTPPGPNNPVPIHDYSTPYTMPDGTPVDTSGWSATDIAKALAAGYLLNAIVGPLLNPKSGLDQYKQQFLPIPTYNGAGLVNQGVNPGFIQPDQMYGQQAPGVDSYYWGQHGYAQNMSDLGNYNTNAVNAPATPYGNPNAANLGKLATFNYPTQETMAGAYGSVGSIPFQAPQLNLSGDIYHNNVQMNTPTPAIAGHPGAFGPNSYQNMAVGQGMGQQYGQSLNYAFTPPQLATTGVNQTTTGAPGANTPAARIGAVSPSDLAAQLLAQANAAGGG